MKSNKTERVQRASDWHNARWCQIPPAVATDLRMTLIHYRILAYLGRVGKGNGWAEFSQKEVAKLFGVARTTVNEATKDLVEWGYLKKRSQEETKSAFCHYKVVLDNDGDVSARDDTPPDGACRLEATPLSAEDDTRVGIKDTHLETESVSNTPPTPSADHVEGVCAKWGKEIAELWAEESPHRHVVELLVGPLHSRKRRASGIPAYFEFLRSIRDRVGERDFSVSVLERAFELLDEGRSVMPALPQVLGTCERAQREHDAEMRTTKQQIAIRAHEAVEPATSSRTEALRERLRNRLGRNVVDSWFDELVCESFAHGCLTISAGAKFKRDWINNNFGEQLRDCATAEFPHLERLSLVARDQARRSAA